MPDIEGHGPKWLFVTKVTLTVAGGLGLLFVPVYFIDLDGVWLVFWILSSVIVAFMGLYVLSFFVRYDSAPKLPMLHASMAFQQEIAGPNTPCEMCTICQEPFTKSDMLRTAPNDICCHVFHTRCIDPYVQRMRGDTRCPNCMEAWGSAAIRTTNKAARGAGGSGQGAAAAALAAVRPSTAAEDEARAKAAQDLKNAEYGYFGGGNSSTASGRYVQDESKWRRLERDVDPGSRESKWRDNSRYRVEDQSSLRSLGSFEQINALPRPIQEA